MLRKSLRFFAGLFVRLKAGLFVKLRAGLFERLRAENEKSPVFTDGWLHNFDYINVFVLGFMYAKIRQFLLLPNTNHA